MLTSSQTKISQMQRGENTARKFKKLRSPRFIATANKIESIAKSSCSSKGRSSIGSSGSSSSSSQIFEGGSSEGKEEETRAQEDPYYDEDYGDEDEVDPNDPYHINRINRIPHDSLKEMYTQVVDELLDIQLEFEEKLADAEEQAHVDLDNQKAELTEEH